VPVSFDPAPDAVQLAALAAELVRATSPECPDPPFLLALAASACDGTDPHGADAEILELGPSTNPVTLLCHQQPKPEWMAAGVLVNGWTVPPDAAVGIDWRTMTPTVPLSVHPARRAVRTLHIVSRGGAVALAMHGEGADAPEVNATDDGGEPGGPCGPLPDSLRRLFGLPTPPSPVTALELWASLWLQALVRTHCRRSTTWATVARIHPASALLEDDGIRATPENLVVAGRALAVAKGWDDLQLRAVTGSDAWSILPPSDVAAWADAGMFARLVLRNIDPLWASRRSLGRGLSRTVLGLVDDVLAEWQLDTAPPGSLSAA
jgi:hypothetical protein